MAKGTLKKNHRGFSLIEVLIAMVILVIVSIPLLRSLRITSRLNSRSRQIAQATTVAGNVMERLRPLTVAEIRAQLSGQEELQFLFNRDANGFRIASGEEAVTSADLTQDYEAEQGRYRFAVYGLTENGARYDARVTVDASHYRGNGGGDARDDIAYAYNNESYVTVSNYNPDTDFMMTQNFTDDTQMFSRMRLALSRSDLSDEEISQNVQRTIVVRIEPMGTQAEVSCRVEYQWIGRGTAVSLNPLYYGAQTFDLTGDKALGNIFLLYVPNYAARNVVNGRYLDVIRIENPGNIPVRANIIKQRIVGDTTITMKESLYRAYVRVEEGSGEHEVATSIRTNLGADVGSTGGGSYSITHYWQQARYAYAGGHFSGDRALEGYISPFGQSSGEAYIGSYLKVESLIEGMTSSSELIYDTTVEVFPAGENLTGTPLVILSSED